MGSACSGDSSSSSSFDDIPKLPITQRTIYHILYPTVGRQYDPSFYSQKVSPSINKHYGGTPPSFYHVAPTRITGVDLCNPVTLTIEGRRNVFRYDFLFAALQAYVRYVCPSRQAAPKRHHKTHHYLNKEQHDFAQNGHLDNTPQATAVREKLCIEMVSNIVEQVEQQNEQAYIDLFSLRPVTYETEQKGKLGVIEMNTISLLLNNYVLFPLEVFRLLLNHMAKRQAYSVGAAQNYNRMYFAIMMIAIPQSPLELPAGIIETNSTAVLDAALTVSILHYEREEQQHSQQQSVTAASSSNSQLCELFLDFDFPIFSSQAGEVYPASFACGGTFLHSLAAAPRKFGNKSQVMPLVLRILQSFISSGKASTPKVAETSAFPPFASSPITAFVLAVSHTHSGEFLTELIAAKLFVQQDFQDGVTELVKEIEKSSSSSSSVGGIDKNQFFLSEDECLELWKALLLMPVHNSTEKARIINDIVNNHNRDHESIWDQPLMSREVKKLLMVNGIVQSK